MIRHHRNDHFNFNANAVWQRTHANSGSCVATAFTEYFDKKIGAAVYHFWMIGEFRRRIDHSENLYDLADTIQIAIKGFAYNSDQNKADCARMLVTILCGHIQAELSLDRPGSFPRKVKKIADLFVVDISSCRTRQFWKGETQFHQSVSDTHVIPPAPILYFD
jgi:hypothetical protein